MQIHTKSITLGALLKWAGVVGTGGEAKQLIAERRALVNGQVELRRGRHLVEGDRVIVQDGPVLVIAGGDHAETPSAVASRVS